MKIICIPCQQCTSTRLLCVTRGTRTLDGVDPYCASAELALPETDGIRFEVRSPIQSHCRTKSPSCIFIVYPDVLWFGRKLPRNVRVGERRDGTAEQRSEQKQGPHGRVGASMSPVCSAADWRWSECQGKRRRRLKQDKIQCKYIVFTSISEIYLASVDLALAHLGPERS